MITTDIINFTLTVEETDQYDLVADFGEEIDVTLDTAINVYHVGGEEYDGSYNVKPTFTQQVLETARKYLKENVTVEPIEVSRVSNPFGGKTIYIGGIFNG